ncbi:threonine aldolase [Protomyces lactucae-debilis]|uniref:Threonine aldolase n=1 Tax=Protomyces lactucae-debilis TaxID=2754530 RepID=A0A1Y2FH05_PROLT|nr:threonine aldolase [Protomyces lactucae-debilis]ORY82684.1 threonine aldolase [Protomyces lactucae-debilis]
MTATTERPRAVYSSAGDFRSDTVTIPDDAMFAAMKQAHLGDDVYNESETTQDLEQYIADLCGKEAGLFCTSGTQGNQICLRTHLMQPPASVLCDKRAHIINYEAAGLAIFSQAMPQPIVAKNGKYLTLEEIQGELITGDDIHFADTRIVSLENTLNGVVFPYEEMKRISEWVRAQPGQRIVMHLDGARLWEASAATGVTMQQYGELFDTMSLCLSKGIGAPIGTVIVGTKDVMTRAKRFRKMMGGGLRQVGILTGAARYALDQQFPRGLKRVHEMAARAAQQAQDAGLTLKFPANTNMLWLDLGASGIEVDAWIKQASALGLIISGERLVFHHQISEKSEQAVAQLIQHFAR